MRIIILEATKQKKKEEKTGKIRITHINIISYAFRDVSYGQNSDDDDDDDNQRRIYK